MKKEWPALARRCREALSKYRYVLLVLAAGVLLMLLPGGDGGGGEEPAPAAAEAAAFDLEKFEEKLERTLSQIDGAGEVSVVLTLEGSSRQVLAQDRDSDGAGGGASTTVTVGRGTGGQEVVPLQTLAPSFRGALVVCPGGGEARVQLRLVEAVSALTGLGSDRISVCQGNPSF